MRVLVIEPYYGGSHQAWADGLAQHSHHDITLLTLPAQFWKWRMRGGAVTVARMLRDRAVRADVILVSDMLDVSILRALIPPDLRDVPLALYFHENQLSYPQNRRQGHGYQYAFINYASALAADAIFFNSAYHLQDFFEELPRMLKHFADYNELQTISQLREKAAVLPLGMDLARFDRYRTEKDPNEEPLIVWNHRWEADKDPHTFFEALYALDAAGYDFQLALLGENFRQEPTEFRAARAHFGSRVIQYGFSESFEAYAGILWQADYVISTAKQDFFGIAVCEAIYCRCVPLLANRLNYPHLLPESAYNACLFRDGALRGLLAQHLQGNISVDVDALRAQVARYDWAQMIERYDVTLASLV